MITHTKITFTGSRYNHLEFKVKLYMRYVVDKIHKTRVTHEQFLISITINNRLLAQLEVFFKTCFMLF